MKNKGSYKIISALFLTVALLFTVFIFMEFRKNYFLVIVSGIASLIGLYFYIDSLEKEKIVQRQKESEDQMAAQKIQQTYLEKLENLEKTFDVTIKEGNNSTQELLKQMNQQVQEISGRTKILEGYLKSKQQDAGQILSIKTALELMYGEQRNAIELNRNGIKVVLKYNKENAKQIAQTFRDSLSSFDKDLKENLEMLKNEIEKLGETKSIKLDERYENLSNVVSDNTITMSDDLKKISNNLNKLIEKMGSEEEQKYFNEQKESAVTKELDTPLEDISLIQDDVLPENNNLSEDDALLESNILSQENIMSEDDPLLQNDSSINDNMESIQQSESKIAVQSPIDEIDILSLPINNESENDNNIIISEAADEKPEDNNIITDSNVNEKMSEDEIAALLADTESIPKSSAAIEEVNEKPEDNNIITDSNVNEKMSEDEIAALLADTAIIPENSAAIEEVNEKPEDNNIITSSNPNAKMSEDEIAALLANTASIPESSAAIEEVNEKPEDNNIITDSNVNAKMSEDEIAALLADTTIIPESSAAIEEVNEKPEDNNIITSSNPNAKMNEDEIAALFAAATGSSTSEKETKKQVTSTDFKAAAQPNNSATNSNPNAKLSEDEIAALFAAATGGSSMLK